MGWDEHDAGYIHNVAGTNATAGIVDGVRTFPTSGLSISNVGTQDSQYNTASTLGGRASALLQIGDNWTITPQFIGQRLNSNGVFGYDPAVGDLNVAHYGPEGYHDSLTQSSLTVEGKISNFDLVYAGGWFDRNEHTVSDYSDYSYFYDKFFGSGCNWVTQAGYQYLQANPTASLQLFQGHRLPCGLIHGAAGVCDHERSLHEMEPGAQTHHTPAVAREGPLGTVRRTPGP